MGHRLPSQKIGWGLVCLCLGSSLWAAEVKPVIPSIGINTLAPQRIVSTALVGDEILLDLLKGAEHRIQGLSPLVDDPRYSNHLKASKSIPHRSQPQMEALWALKPDFILSASLHSPDFLNLLQSHPPCKTLILSNFSQLNHIPLLYKQVGEAIGTAAQAASLVHTFEQATKQAASRAAHRKTHPHVLAWIGGFQVLGTGTIMDDLIHLAGGVSVVARQLGVKGWASLHGEALLTLKGHVDVVVLQVPFPLSELTPTRRQTLIHHFHQESLHAFPSAHIVMIPEALLASLSLKVLDALAMMEQGFYP